MNSRFDGESVKRMLRTCLKEEYPELSQKDGEEFIFHMTDWLDELEGLCEAYSNAASRPPSEAKRAVLDFLIHAPEHISAAAEIFTGTGVEHIFKRPLTP